MTISEYKEKLRKHDWFWMMSDDPRSRDRGVREEENLKKLAEENKRFMKEYTKMEKTMFPVK